MAKYSYEFKLKLVKEYLNGSLGYNLLVKKYDVPDEFQISRWVRSYKDFGVEGP